MQLITAEQATGIVTEVVKYFSQNWVAFAVLIGFGVGFRLFRSILNRTLNGRGIQPFGGVFHHYPATLFLILGKYIMTTQEILMIITRTIADNFSALLGIIAVGAGVKIVLDIIFRSLYSITSSRD